MISIEELKTRLAKLGLKQPQKWLVKQTGYKENSVRQYLGPKGKGTPKFIREALAAIEAEEARQKVDAPQAPPWNLIFQSQDEFDRADRASRVAKAESITEFCRTTILEKADDLLASKKRSPYPAVANLPSSKVAEQHEKP